MEYEKVFFDFDSTLVHEETLDLLAWKKGVGEEVSRLTAQSMEGLVPVAEVFRRKMGILSPSRRDFDEFSTCCTRIFTRDAPLLIEALHWLGKEVYVLSSGLHEIIDPAAALLGIPRDRVFANRVLFDENGNYADLVDEEVPIASDGKAQALRRIPAAKTTGVMVGDAVTDMATRNDVALFVGFGGVARRQKVVEEAAVYIACRSLGALLQVVTTTDEFNALLCSGRFRNLARRAWRQRTRITRK